jgi:hypothetical protein
MLRLTFVFLINIVKSCRPMEDFSSRAAGWGITNEILKQAHPFPSIKVLMQNILSTAPRQLVPAASSHVRAL